ncbi:CRISPR system precrRNA processing endoribonuclease RAMP protein Cas6 [Actinobacillus equuli]|uniref:CRISPR system precrRNA processing endoribonuclease RAMP protein Cas6 n=1 Tax=Actinobacillus equuli TaxID=718 RepID=UPI00244338DC|nr:CRISPR system precrRNA processing endoribonuclease RAMP protein Cas6 [Actinobacillus equuli]WGE85079.1 CRISPR system precrRNA processing endoribonuclease RAMP protein Cas6 [Actinobacillus equuli subsp. haemolyticus]
MQTQFPIVRYQFHFKVTEPILLPEYAGSTLRGAFGRALRRIACMTKQDNCKECPLYRTCPYTNIFETPAPAEHDLQKFSQVPNGYIIEPPKWGEKIYSVGEELSFSVVLFGRLLEQLPLIAFAFKRAFEYNVGKGKADLIDIARIVENQTAVQSILVNGNIIEYDNKLVVPNHFSTKLSIKIQTPLRLQENGKPLRENYINAERFFISLAKRISLLSEFHYQPLNLNFEQIKQDISQVKENKNLRWQDWTRYSSRQDRRMKLGGVVGEWHFAGLSPRLAQLLYIGQWLHNGKNATFGLGKYQITNL